VAGYRGLNFRRQLSTLADRGGGGCRGRYLTAGSVKGRATVNEVVPFGHGELGNRLENMGPGSPRPQSSFCCLFVSVKNTAAHRLAATDDGQKQAGAAVFFAPTINQQKWLMKSGSHLVHTVISQVPPIAAL
jgi:hypothetical protein